jgi:hypothetical protein
MELSHKSSARHSPSPHSTARYFAQKKDFLLSIRAPFEVASGMRAKSRENSPPEHVLCGKKARAESRVGGWSGAGERLAGFFSGEIHFALVSLTLSPPTPSHRRVHFRFRAGCCCRFFFSFPFSCVNFHFYYYNFFSPSCRSQPNSVSRSHSLSPTRVVCRKKIINSRLKPQSAARCDRKKKSRESLGMMETRRFHADSRRVKFLRCSWRRAGQFFGCLRCVEGLATGRMNIFGGIKDEKAN